MKTKVYLLCLYTQAGLEKVLGVYSEQNLAECEMAHHYRGLPSGSIWPSPNDYEIEECYLDGKA